MGAAIFVDTGLQIVWIFDVCNVFPIRPNISDTPYRCVDPQISGISLGGNYGMST